MKFNPIIFNCLIAVAYFYLLLYLGNFLQFSSIYLSIYLIGKYLKNNDMLWIIDLCIEFKISRITFDYYIFYYMIVLWLYVIGDIFNFGIIVSFSFLIGI